MDFKTCGIEDVWNWGVVDPETCGFSGAQKELVSSTRQVPASMVRHDMSACLLYRVTALSTEYVQCRVLHTSWAAMDDYPGK